MEILFIDDQEDIREIMSMLLEDYIKDAKVTCFSGSEAASDYIQTSKSNISLIISDYNLTGETGLNLYDKVKELNIPFFLMTGMVFENDNTEVNEFIKRSSNKVLQKPVGEEELVKVINSIL